MVKWLFANTVKKECCNSKRIVVLFGSPHSDGITAKLLSEFLLQIPQEYKNEKIEIFSTYKVQAKACADCGYCKIYEGCAFSDIDNIYSSVENADILLIATPVYNLTFPSHLKAILDRFQRYYNARFSLGKKPPIPKPKKAILFVTGGSDCIDGVEIIEKQLKMIFTILNTTLVDTVAEIGTDSLSYSFGKNNKNLKGMAERLFD